MQIANLKFNPIVWIVLVAVLMATILSFLSPFFFTIGNMTNLSKQVSIVAILAAGQAVVIISGGIDLSVGSVLAFSAVVIGTLIQMDINPTVAMFAGLFSGTFAGCINGLVITWAKIPPFIATLGMLGIARGMALVITGGVSHPVLSPLFSFYWKCKTFRNPHSCVFCCFNVFRHRNHDA